MGQIRVARSDELERLRAIEVAAGIAFADVGLPAVAAHDPLSVADLEERRAEGRLWVIVDGDEVAGYVLIDLVDGAPHVEQVSVHPDHARRGLGRQLLDHVAAWASARGHRTVTLTTFVDVPWNAPYYARCGYGVLRHDELGPELRALMATEAAHGLDPARRVAMAHNLP
ncbi:MAG TPA: GNAT family N-acetyltransferase [Acidimicrobiales bacterium]|nr:GNAT family N-acetyltransferase [Acidimicrobiales bacterium]